MLLHNCRRHWAVVVRSCAVGDDAGDAGIRLNRRVGLESVLATRHRLVATHVKIARRGGWLSPRCVTQPMLGS